MGTGTRLLRKSRTGAHEQYKTRGTRPRVLFYLILFRPLRWAEFCETGSFALWAKFAGEVGRGLSKLLVILWLKIPLAALIIMWKTSMTFLC